MRVIIMYPLPANCKLWLAIHLFLWRQASLPAIEQTIPFTILAVGLSLGARIMEIHPGTNPAPATQSFVRHGRRRSFPHRFLLALGLSQLIVSISLGIGVLGYHFIAGFEWVDAILNASMILTGMGPVGNLTTTSAKLFASAYALFSGVVFISATGILLAPIFHRVLHQFHIDERDMK